MKYKKDHAYRGTIPSCNVTVDCQYNPDNDYLFIKLINGEETITINLNKKMREQLRDALDVEYDPS